MVRSLWGRFSAALLMVSLLTFVAPASHAQLALTQSSTSRKMVFVMFATGTTTPTAGLTVAVTLSKNGGTSAAGAGAAPTDIGNGLYAYTPTTADTNTLGSLILRATATGADPSIKEFNVILNSPDVAPSDSAGTTTLLTRIPGVVQPQTGDAFARLGVAGAGLTALGDTRLANLDAAITSRMATFGLPTNFVSLLIDGTGKTALQSAEHTAIATDVLGATASSYNASLTIGNKINAAASAGDPWSTTLPGAYGAGTAGFIVGTNLNATITSRMATFGLPSNFSSLLISGGGGTTVGAYASGQDPATLVLGATIDSGNGLTLTFKQAAFLNFVASVGKFGTPVRTTSSPYTITVPLLRLDGTTTGWTYITTYTDSTFSKASGRTFTAGTLP
jgi:hypothetical protein